MGRKRKTHDEFCSEIEGRNISVIGNYIRSTEKILMRCDECGGTWKATPKSITQGSGCPACWASKQVGVNKIIKDNGPWLIIDISTPKHPNATMACDTDDFIHHIGGRICACEFPGRKYISAIFKQNRVNKFFHHLVLPKREGAEIDHIKHGTIDFIDNRILNLRYATRSQNMMNKSIRKDNKSGVTGVIWDESRSRWRSEIKFKGKNIYLGRFQSFESAVSARNDAEIKYFGEYAFNA